ncbi:enoyl-CoA hydratase/isomerase family protein [Colwellia maritima]|uniref:enoyl-CoA hydratase/isomerase family protein n=1 Tax=Colwellia maritima TaxID=2912588 RepID=UPI003083F58F
MTPTQILVYSPVFGGAAILPKLVPVNVAKYLLFTGKSLPASEMKQYGLVNEIVEHEQLYSRVQELCDDLAEKSPLVLQRMKKIANQAQDQTRQSALDSELLELREHFLSADIQEGLAAFSEKRKPVFIGN